MSTLTDSGAIFKAVWLLLLLLAAGCQAFTGSDALATIDTDMTALAVERENIRAAATADRDMAVATVVAAGTRVAQLSDVNAALAATLRTSYTETPALRAVEVSAADMGSSLEGGMMDDAPGIDTPPEISVSSLAMAADTDFNSGCAETIVRSFTPAAERIYLTAQVSNLSAGTQFSALWRYDGQDVYSHSWRAERSRAFWCIWFYATPADFAFLPGSYTALLYVDDVLAGSVPFSITAQ
ncbi:MAG: hypothetical protein OXE46_05315 [Chloroflexi bacterium]|nr:hypothetical protein [Chloroflexota bacterium]